MKKRFALFLITSLAFAPVKAQDIKFGAKAGVNLATLQPDLPDPANKTGFHLGGMAEIPLMDMLSLQPELLYSAQGVKDESDDDEVVRLNYLTVPVLAKYYVIDGLSIEAGPQFGFLLTAEFEDNGETDDIKDNTKSVDVGLAIGAGYKLENGLNFCLRYYLGSDINDIGEDPEKFKNRVFQISVGYFFNVL
ncbi:MAG: PorT family protein [Cyclobacteriaceae bacterium]|nr:PorT family protein [Cyclobacteriaceae bacterium]